MRSQSHPTCRGKCSSVAPREAPRTTRGQIAVLVLYCDNMFLPIHSHRERVLIFKNAKQIAGASIFAASSGLFGTAIVSRWRFSVFWLPLGTVTTTQCNDKFL